MDTAAKVLIVDDDETLLPYYGRVLAGAGFAVRHAKTGVEALAILTHEAYDVVVMDCQVAGNDGLGILAAIKKLSPDTAVVVVTRASSVDQAKAAIRLGACDYLAKPVSFDEVSKAVGNAAIQKKWALRRIPVRETEQPNHEGVSI